MTDWRDHFSEPRCGFVHIVGEDRVEYRFLTDFGYVLFKGQPKLLASDPDVLRKMQNFAREKWEAGEDGPFKWTGEL